LPVQATFKLIWPDRIRHKNVTFYYQNCDAFRVKVKLKVKVNVEFTLEQAMKVERGSRGIVYYFFNLGARCGRWSMPRSGRFTPWRHPVSIV